MKLKITKLNISFGRALLITGFIVLTAIPYFIHPSQDLPYPVEHDEAAFHLNSKDVVMFGAASLVNDRKKYIMVPLQALLGVISFSFLGCSLLSLRLLYIILNIAGNVLFFSFLKKHRGLGIAMVTSASFMFFTDRFIFGKAAMAESLALPLLLVLVWCLSFVPRNTRVYFWVGVLGMLVFWTKLDNVFAPVFLTGLAVFDSVKARKKGDRKRARTIISFYALGVGLIVLIWLGFYSIAGWEKVLFYLSYDLRPNLNVASFRPEDSHSPFAVATIINNLQFMFKAQAGFAIVSVICLIPFFYLFKRVKKEHIDPLARAILLFLVLLIGKILISGLLYERRFVPCFPLPFLLIAYLGGISAVPGTWNPSKYAAWLGKLPEAIKRKTEKGIVILFIGVMGYIAWIPGTWRATLRVIFFPTYNAVEESRIINRVCKKGYKALFLDGLFSYAALQSPLKFIDIPPDLEASGHYEVESNLPLAERILEENPDIRYVFCLWNNAQAIQMIEKKFHGELIADQIRRFGLLYYLPERDSSSVEGRDKN